MKKKLMFSFLILLTFILVVGCGKKEDNEFALSFKKDYESMNDKTNSRGIKYRSISLNENNKFKEITQEDLIEKLNNNESFYIYFGSTLCPWCRSVIEMADKISRENDIDVIYYLDIWDDDGNEIFRDKYVLNSNNNLELSVEGTSAYKLVLERFNDFLSDYSLTDSNGSKIDVGEKRVYAPNFAYVLNGKAIRLITGISEKQDDSHMELTNEMLEDEEKSFKNFFSNSCSSDSKC